MPREIVFMRTMIYNSFELLPFNPMCSKSKSIKLKVLTAYHFAFVSTLRKRWHRL